RALRYAQWSLSDYPHKYPSVQFHQCLSAILHEHGSSASGHIFYIFPPVLTFHQPAVVSESAFPTDVLFVSETVSHPLFYYASGVSVQHSYRQRKRNR